MAKKATPAAPPATSDNVDNIIDALIGAPPTPAEQEPAPDPNETIKIVEEPPEVTDVAPAFHEATAEELKEFPPPPPLVASVAAPLAMDDKTTNGKAIMGTRTEPPKVVETLPAEPPSGPAFDDLPEKTKAEMRAGRQTIGGGDTPLSLAVEQQAPNQPPAADVPDARPADDELDLSKLPERTRREIQAGRDLLARKKADYKVVTDKVAKDAAQKLGEGAPAAAGDLDYPRG